MATTVTRWNPWQELEAFRREVDGLFRSGETGRRSGGPAWNVYRSEEGVVLTSELPGYDPDAFEVESKRDALTIRGRRVEPTGDDDRFLRRERRDREFEQTLKLPFVPDTEKTEAEYRHGILTLKLWRSPAEQPRKIAVKTV
ncbi:Hsp20/alpha crystallin family protein [Stratiformator vulcanicus]|uniref:18 kDa heat shock protein n=1 Tax=Stratiformator vulcanicus TaxID=2527980 RepID=A0A517QYQ8_9PLAN|nr:Hsp20/alpha crystallin family protein [Stratiformator vulcanicus]QDT36723.1 18 kDa heat shock protein [Stratiformator vulcanicus]